MNNKCGKNTAASVRDRLLALARERGEDFQLLLTQYGLERLLYRLSQSSYRDRFILKGAMLFLLWGDQPHRPTRDVDFLGFGDSSEAGLQAIFRELCGIPVEDDGLTLIAESVQVETIRDETEYGGIRVRLFGDLAGARVPIQADIGFGDAVTPEAKEAEYPTLLGKTVVGAWLIAERQCNTLVLVHRQPLLDQWIAQLALFLGLDIRDIGRIGGGRHLAVYADRLSQLRIISTNPAQSGDN